MPLRKPLSLRQSVLPKPTHSPSRSRGGPPTSPSPDQRDYVHRVQGVWCKIPRYIDAMGDRLPIKWIGDTISDDRAVQVGAGFRYSRPLKRAPRLASTTVSPVFPLWRRGGQAHISRGIGENFLSRPERHAIGPSRIRRNGRHAVFPDRSKIR
jgi:hypothetical protein